MNWLQPIITCGVIPLVKYFVKRGDQRRAEDESRARDEERERERLRALTAKRIKEAKEGYKDIDPSRHEV